ncbi:MAG: hypothetical protein GYB67_14665 [Chloroflexi bacterium]|nr:hypothetical protein [Chloroflexota bacterium]
MMARPRVGLLGIAVLLIGLVSGCADLMAAPGPGDSAPAIQLIPQTPDGVARAFLDAWNTRDYEAMYRQIHSRSQGMTPFDEFRAAYESVDAQIGTSGLTYTITGVVTQDRTARVTYDLTLQSTRFDSIADSGRRMRLERNGSGWGIAWSTMDIFEGLVTPEARLVEQTEQLPRANIYDRSGQLLVEERGTVVELYIAWQDTNFDVCMDLLAWVLRSERARLVAQTQIYNPETIYYVGDMDVDEFAEYEGRLIDACSIRTAERETRRYVGHGIATHTVGYVGSIPADLLEEYRSRGYPDDALVGLVGIEAAYEAYLAGEPSRQLAIETGGLTVRQLAANDGIPPQPITLTLDLDLQTSVASTFVDAYNYAAPNWAEPGRSAGGGLVVIDVHTGAILAMGSYPSFDPGIFSPDIPGTYADVLVSDTRQPFLNRASQNSYAPGSSFKIVTTAAAAQEGMWPQDQLFDCQMEWDGRAFGDSLTVRLDWRATEAEEFRFATGPVDIAGALTASCNPFFYQMGAALFNRNPRALSDYARRMGLGQLTGLNDLPLVAAQFPEDAGRIQNPSSVDQAISEAIGQYETQVTVLQMARMVAGIANGGVMYQPYLVERIGPQNAPLFAAAPNAAEPMRLTEETLDIIRRGMCDVTDADVYGASGENRLGTAWDPFWETPYRVCGKTGTAQTGQIEPHGWFVAYSWQPGPGEDWRATTAPPPGTPAIAIAAMIENSREGSQTAAPIIRRVLDDFWGAEVYGFPQWWRESYVPLNIPENGTGG